MSTALAEKAPRSPEELFKEAEVVVVGQITDLKIGTQRSHIERGFGNYDWMVDLTIKIIAVEKGTLASSNAVVARCFRIKSRKSIVEYISVSGNHPIPGVGSTVRAHLYRNADSWRVVFPNGLVAAFGQTTLTDAAVVGQLRCGGYTYLLPAELWALVAVVFVIAAIVLLAGKRIVSLLRSKA